MTHIIINLYTTSYSRYNSKSIIDNQASKQETWDDDNNKASQNDNKQGKRYKYIIIIIFIIIFIFIFLFYEIQHLPLWSIFFFFTFADNFQSTK